MHADRQCFGFVLFRSQTHQLHRLIIACRAGVKIVWAVGPLVRRLPVRLPQNYLQNYAISHDSV